MSPRAKGGLEAITVVVKADSTFSWMHGDRLHGGFHGGTPSYHPFLDGISPEINHAASLGYPHGYGNPHMICGYSIFITHTTGYLPARWVPCIPSMIRWLISTLLTLDNLRVYPVFDHLT